MTHPAPPSCTFLTSIRVRVGPAIEVGETSEGVRRVIPIVWGEFSGPELTGTVLPAGADFQLLRTPSTTELEAKYVLATDQGDRIYVSNVGIRTGSPEDIAALVAGVHVDPERIYFRSTPRFSAGGQWSWLGTRIFIASGIRLPDEVRLDVFMVE
ncbi:DUF3237 domain-containing protein [Pseudarthrobacter sp. YS3]|uniref:DUF3237 domain-containing protein n=1 Tax=Pseudarthrobacter sp. YS3 TaxID=3453718 RepID=UPI003EEE2257